MVYKLGVITHKEDSRFSTQYRAVKNKVLGIEPTKNSDQKERSKTKFDHAVAWIQYIADLFAEVGYGENNTNKRFLPFDTITEFYEDYLHYHRSDNEHIRDDNEKKTCSKETFRKAFQSLQHTVKLRTAKGAFETCCVCNNLNDCLKNTSGDWTQAQVDLILRLKRLHLLQQAEERIDSNKRRMDALQNRDKEGNFTSIYLEIDGYTEFKTKSPICGKRKSKGDTKRIGNRVIGVVVACGPIDTRFVYLLNDLISGGANIMIEVVRHALYDLGVLLARLKLSIPKTLYLQFDNCGENKVSDFIFSFV